MKIIKNLIRLISLFFILTVVLAVIYFRTVLLPDDINEPIDTALSELGDKIGVEIPSYKPEVGSSTDDSVINEVKQVAKEDVEAETSESNKLSVDTDADTNMVAAITESVTKTVNKFIGSDEDKGGDVQEEDGQIEAVSEDDKPSGVESIVNKTAKAIEGSIEHLAGKANTSSNSELSDSRKMLIHARKAFWGGDMEEAEKVYRKLTESEEIDPNTYGELGNVYYAQGKWQEAGRAYYEAAVRLIELEQPYQVNYLLRVIQGLDSESAEKLKQKISG